MSVQIDENRENSVTKLSEVEPAEFASIQETEIKVTKYRWVILLIFCLNSATTYLQYLQYTIIANVIRSFYKTSEVLVKLTGLLFMIAAVTLFLPVSYVSQKCNLKKFVTISSGLTFVGTVLKLASINPDRFYIVLIGQSFIAISNVIYIALPTKLASTWFGPEQVSMASSIGILGLKAGTAFGLLFPGLIVGKILTEDKIRNGLWILCSIYTVLSATGFILAILFFKAEPDYAPSMSAVISHNEVDIGSVLKNFFKIFTNKQYLLLLLVFSLAGGIWGYFGIDANIIYLEYFPVPKSFDGTVTVGILTFATLLVGCGSANLVFGFILDKTHAYKPMSYAIIILSAVTYAALVIFLHLKIAEGTYVLVPLFGFFIGTTVLLGFEYATEIVFPLSAPAACSILNATTFLFSIFYAMFFGLMHERIGLIFVHICVVSILIIASLLVFFLKPIYHRYNANYGIT